MVIIILKSNVLKFNKMEKRFAFMFILFFGSVINIYAQNIQERARIIRDQSSQQINRAVQNTREQVNRSAESARKNINQGYNNSRDAANREIERQRTNENSYYNTTRNNVNQAVENVRSSTSSTLREANEAFKTTMTNTIHNGYELSRYERQSSDMVTNITIAGFKNVPVYDYENDRLVSMDTYCRQMITQMGGSDSDGDFGKDPVATTVMIMMDRNYLYNAKIIQEPNGNWMSINDALDMGLLTPGVEQDYRNARNAYYDNDPVEFDKSFNSFMTSVNSYNATVQRKSSVLTQNRLSVKNERSYFHNSPDYSTRRKAYCIKNDVVDVLDKQGNWVFVRFNGPKISSVGWMPRIELATY